MELDRTYHNKYKSLKEIINNEISKQDWLNSSLWEFIIITKDILDLYGLNEEETSFITKIERLKIPFIKVPHTDKRLFIYNDITNEMRNKPNKKTWYLMSAKNFKRALYSVSGTRLNCDLKKFHIEMEDAMRKYLLQDEERKTEKEQLEDTIEHVMLKFSRIIDDKIINKLVP
ncbi:hypothetical protein [Dasineura jujubifolia toursvirus 2a]|nr:hypothetical protein [Dasineura jujubifolia toursvirus 2a]